LRIPSLDRRHNALNSFFDLIVADVRLPDLTATEALAALRCRAWNAPVILVTAFGDPETRREARELGVFAVLDKPVAHDELRAKLRAVARGHAGAPSLGGR
jgi:DNA-binding response OmpR family regulator